MIQKLNVPWYLLVVSDKTITTRNPTMHWAFIYLHKDMDQGSYSIIIDFIEINL